jgi:uroporphyrinogen-III synthase
VLAAGLRAQGWQVDRVVAYHTDAPEASAEPLREALRRGVDLVIFASPSAVETFVEAAGEDGSGIPAAVIGPTTASAAAVAGMEVRITASPATAEGLLHAIARYYSTGSGERL